MIQFEEVSDEQRQMMSAVGSFIAALGTRPDGENEDESAEHSAPDLLKAVMTGELAQYSDQLFSTAGGGVALSEEQQLEVDMRIINEHPDKSSDFARGLGSQEVAHVPRFQVRAVDEPLNQIL